MNRLSGNIFLIDMMNISIESFELLQNKINHIQNKKLFHYVISKDAFLSKGASNEEMANFNFIFVTFRKH